MSFRLVRPHLLNSSKTKWVKAIFATGKTVGPTEWIIDDTCLLNLIISGVEVGQEPQEESEDDDDDEEFSDEAVIEEVEDDEHLTFATHSTHEYLLKNVQRLLRHWPTSQPISLAIFAPGQDFCTATALVSWLWNCQKNVSKQISFHLFFPADYANDVASKTASEGMPSRYQAMTRIGGHFFHKWCPYVRHKKAKTQSFKQTNCNIIRDLVGQFKVF